MLLNNHGYICAPPEWVERELHVDQWCDTLVDLVNARKLSTQWAYQIGQLPKQFQKAWALRMAETPPWLKLQVLDQIRALRREFGYGKEIYELPKV